MTFSGHVNCQRCRSTAQNNGHKIWRNKSKLDASFKQVVRTIGHYKNSFIDSRHLFTLRDFWLEHTIRDPCFVPAGLSSRNVT